MQAHKLPNQEELQKTINDLMNKSVYSSLCDYIRIPNVTHGFYPDNNQWIKDKPEGAPDSQDGGFNLIKKAGQHIVDWVNSLKIEGAKTTLELYQNKDRTPAIIIEIESSGVGDNKEDTYFFYGHYDKQPPMEGVSGWAIGAPYDPTPIIDQTTGEVIKLYGRGGADDGYSTYATMVAIKALQLQGIPLPRIVMIAEGDEETGNGDVEYWIDHYLTRFGTPKLVFCLDSGTLDYDRFWLTNSLRGYLVLQFSVQVLTDAVHSGSGTGVIPTCFRIIRQLLERIESAATGQMPKLDLLDGIPPNRVKEVEDLVAELGDKAIPEYPTVPGLLKPFEDPKETILLNTWRSQMEVLSVDGYPPIGQTSNIINPKISVKLSIRLPPTKNHIEAKEAAEKELYSLPYPYNCVIEHVESISDGGFDSPANPQALTDVFEQASQVVFGKKHLSMGQGGSIPFMNYLRTKWGDANFVITGLLGPESSAHGPNECLRFDYLKKLTACFSQIIARSIPVYFQQKEDPSKDKECEKPHHHHHHHHHGHHGHHGHHHHHHKKHRQAHQHM